MNNTEVLLSQEVQELRRMFDSLAAKQDELEFQVEAINRDRINDACRIDILECKNTTTKVSENGKNHFDR
jgi:hypothetical protein